MVHCILYVHIGMYIDNINDNGRSLPYIDMPVKSTMCIHRIRLVKPFSVITSAVPNRANVADI